MRIMGEALDVNIFGVKVNKESDWINGVFFAEAMTTIKTTRSSIYLLCLQKRQQTKKKSFVQISHIHLLVCASPFYNVSFNQPDCPIAPVAMIPCALVARNTLYALVKSHSTATNNNDNNNYNNNNNNNNNTTTQQHSIEQQYMIEHGFGGLFV
jgi:hypothetical protein